MDYAEFTPLAHLAPYVHCVWSFSSADAALVSDRIVPDGRPELIVHLGEPFAELSADGKWVTQPRALFAGQVTKPLQLRAQGPSTVIGVRFRPAGARPFLGSPLAFATDQRVELEEAMPGVGAIFLMGMMAAGSLSERIELIQEFVADCIVAQEYQRDLTVEACVARIEATAGTLELEAMIEESGLGRRQLERRFSDSVGVGPALLASIFRFRRVFDLLERDATRPWTDAAIAAGYFDQSHFIREFKRFVGCTPTEFVERAQGIAAALAAKRDGVANVQVKGDFPG
jgi:AraC-like DNA-binding protein